MEDDKLKQLFSDFQPELSSDFQFMSRLQHSMEAVELIKAQSEQTRRRNKVAITVAALVGCMAGFAITFAMPAITGWISSFHFPYCLEFAGFDFNGMVAVLTCLMAGIVSTTLTYNAYNITQAHLKSKGTLA